MMADMVLRTIRRHERGRPLPLAPPAASETAGAPTAAGLRELLQYSVASREPIHHTLFRPPLSKQFADVAVSPRDDLSGPRLTRWFYEGHLPTTITATPSAHTAAWWKVMCLTGVDYFSTLAYQPSIAFVAAGTLAPVATLVLVALTLFGAFPMYSRVADLSP